jgi:hypothetical protein
MTAIVSIHASDEATRKTTTMSSAEYNEIVKIRFGLTQEQAGKWLGFTGRTGQNYSARGPSEPVAKLLRLMVRLDLKPEDVR